MSNYTLERVYFNSFTCPTSNPGRSAIRPTAYNLTNSTFKRSNGVGTVTTSTTIPEWIRPGAFLTFNGTTAAGIGNVMDGVLKVVAVTIGSNVFSVIGVHNLVIEQGNSTFTAGSVNLVTHVNKATITAVTATMTVYPYANATWSVALTAGSSYTIESPIGTNFDLSDWVYSGTGTLNVVIV